MRTFLLVIDGGSYPLFKKWTDSGKLPYISSIGPIKPLESTIPISTCPAAISLLSGINPSQLNIKGIVADDGSIISRKNVKHQFIWEYLSDNNQKSLILFTPMTYPIQAFDGIIIPGYGTPSNEGECTFPIEIKEEVDLPDFPQMARDWRGLTKEKVVEKIKATTAKKINIFKQLRNKEKFELTLLYLAETDSMQHYLMDDEEKLLQYYTWLDSELENLDLEYDHFIIASDHGFKRVAEKNFHINTFLKQNNLIQLNNSRPRTKIIKNTLHFLNENWLSGYLKANFPKIRNLFLKASKSKLLASANINKEQSSAYAIDKWGVYTKDAETTKALINQLSNEHGAIFKRITTSKEYYKKNNPDFPQIVFELHDEYDVSLDISEELVSENAIQRHYGLNLMGDHAMEGIFISNPSQAENIKLLDLVPTILSIHKIPIPSELTGSSIYSHEKQNTNMQALDTAIKGIKL